MKTPAERGLGEMLRAQKETVGLARGRVGPGRGKAGAPAGPAFNDAPTLADAGIDKKLSSRGPGLRACHTELSHMWDFCRVAAPPGLRAFHTSEPMTAYVATRLRQGAACPPDGGGSVSTHPAEGYPYIVSFCLKRFGRNDR